MKKCPGCGAIAQDEDKCGMCGAALLEVRSVTLEDLLKEQAGETPGGKQVIHWKRKALLPPLIFSGLSFGLIISGFLLILYSPVPLNFIRWYGGLLLVTIGFLVLLLMVIGSGDAEVRRGARWRS